MAEESLDTVTNERYFLQIQLERDVEGLAVGRPEDNKVQTNDTLVIELQKEDLDKRIEEVLQEYVAFSEPLDLVKNNIMMGQHAVNTANRVQSHGLKELDLIRSAMFLDPVHLGHLNPDIYYSIGIDTFVVEKDDLSIPNADKLRIFDFDSTVREFMQEVDTPFGPTYYLDLSIRASAIAKPEDRYVAGDKQSLMVKAVLNRAAIGRAALYSTLGISGLTILAVGGVAAVATGRKAIATFQYNQLHDQVSANAVSVDTNYDNLVHTFDTTIRPMFDENGDLVDQYQSFSDLGKAELESLYDQIEGMVADTEAFVYTQTPDFVGSSDWVMNENGEISRDLTAEELTSLQESTYFPVRLNTILTVGDIIDVFDTIVDLEQTYQVVEQRAAHYELTDISISANAALLSGIQAAKEQNFAVAQSQLDQLFFLDEQIIAYEEQLQLQQMAQATYDSSQLVYDSIVQIAQEDLAVSMAQDSMANMEANLQAGQYDQVLANREQLNSILNELNQSYEVRFCTESQLGINLTGLGFTALNGNPDDPSALFYFQVCNFAPDGTILTAYVDNAETSAIENDPTLVYGILVSRDLLFEIRDDREEDGIYDHDVIATKPLGYLTPQLSEFYQAVADQIDLQNRVPESVFR